MHLIVHFCSVSFCHNYRKQLVTNFMFYLLFSLLSLSVVLVSCTVSKAIEVYQNSARRENWVTSWNLVMEGENV